MGGAWKTISVALKADAKGYLGPMSAASAATRKLGDEVDSSAKKSAGGWTSLSKIVKVGVAGMVLAVGAFIGASINAAAQFEARMSAIGAVSGATAGQMDLLRDKALQLGADTSFSAGEAASAMEELVKAGVSVEGVLNGAADATVALAAAGEISLPEAAAIAANAMNQFGLSAEQLPHIADLIAGAANASAIDVSEFGMSMSQAGAVANLVGLSFDDTALAITAMGNAGIKSSDAGTSLKTFLTNLVPSTAKASGLMSDLGIITEDAGNRFFDASGNVKSLSEISDVLGESLAGMSKQQQLATLQVLFGSDAIRAAAVVAGEGAEGFKELDGAMRQSTAAEIAAKRMDNLSGSVEQLKGSVETALIIVGTKFLPALTQGADAATGFVNALTSGDTSGGFMASLADTAGRLAPAWRNIRDVAEDLVSILGDAYETAQPLAEAFAKFAAGATVVGLTGIASALSSITGFLAENSAIIKTVITGLAVLAATRAFATLGGHALDFTRKMYGVGEAIVKSQAVSNLGQIGAGFRNMAGAGAQSFTNLNNYTGRFSQGLGQVKAGVSGLAESFLGALSPGMIALGGITIATMLYADAQKGLAEAAAASRARVEALTSAVKNGQESLEDAFDAQLLEKWSKEAEKLNGAFGMDLGIDSFTKFREVVTLSDADYTRWRDKVQAGLGTSDASMDLLTGGIAAAREEFAQAGTEIDRYKEGQAELDSATTGATGAQADQVIASANQAAQFAAVADAAEKAKEAIDKFYGSTTTTTEAQIAAEDSLASVKSTIEENVAALGKAGGALDVYTEAGRKNIGALVDGKNAAVDFALAIADDQGPAAGVYALTGYANKLRDTAISAGASEAEVNALIAKMKLTPADIATQFSQYGVEAGISRFAGLKGSIEAVPATKTTTVSAQALGFGAVQAAINAIPTSREVRIYATKMGDWANLGQYYGGGAARGSAGRWGGITAYAQGGIHAHVQRGERIRYAEPATGGEAFVPRIGNAYRSLAVLNEAAGWYGMDVVPKGQTTGYISNGATSSVPRTSYIPGGGSGGGGITVNMPLHLSVTGNGDKAIADAVRAQVVPAISAQAAGVVQTLRRYQDAH